MESLPPYWYIVNTEETSKRLRDLKKEGLLCADLCGFLIVKEKDITYYYHFKKNYYLDNNKQALIGYEELTIDQLENILKVKKSPKIIGYKLTKSQYLSSVNIICGYTTDCSILEHQLVYVSSVCEEELSKAGVLDLWFTPVFNTEFPRIKGANNTEYCGKIDKDDNTLIHYGCATFKKGFFKALDHLIKSNFPNQNRNIDRVVLDSGVVITAAQIEQIVDNLMEKS